MRFGPPSPLLSAVLFVAWLALNQSASTGHLLLGALLAWAIPLATVRLREPDDSQPPACDPVRPTRPALRRARAALRLGAVVALDIVRSNIEVARRILGRESAIHPRYVWVPLAIRHPHGRVALAGIITMTPGTLSAEFSADGRHLLVHAFNAADPQALVDDIRQRYEAPLMEIFE
jgi:multicomponent K+:H+ antiporter subunit E